MVLSAVRLPIGSNPAKRSRSALASAVSWSVKSGSVECGGRSGDRRGGVGAGEECGAGVDFGAGSGSGERGGAGAGSGGGVAD